MLLPKKANPLVEYFSKQGASKVIGNFFSLVAIQGTNFLIPLLVLPYLVSVIGMAKLGVVTLAQAFVMYWIMFTDYGFNLSTTKEIAFHRDNKAKISEIVSNTLLTKGVLFLVALIAFVLCVTLVPSFSQESTLYYLAFSMVVGQCLIPVWFFQGVEQMKFLTYSNLVSKVLVVLLIFLLVKSPSDYVYVVLFYGLGNIASGLIATWWMMRRFGVKLFVPPTFNLTHELQKGWHIFLSHFSINVYSNSNVFILGFFASDVVVAYYGVAEKVFSIARQLLVVFFQATFPQACKQAFKGHVHLIRFFKLYFIPFFIGIVLLCSGIFIFADYITVFFAKKKIEEIVTSIRLLMVVPIVVCLNIPAFQTLVAYNHQRSYLPVYLLGSLLNIVLNLMLVHFFSSLGTIASVFLTELFITVGLYWVLFRRHPEHRIPLWGSRKHRGLE